MEGENFYQQRCCRALEEDIAAKEVNEICDEYFEECKNNAGNLISGNAIIQKQDRGIYSLS